MKYFLDTVKEEFRYSNDKCLEVGIGYTPDNFHKEYGLSNKIIAKQLITFFLKILI